MQSIALKFVLVGDCRVGKSQLSRSYAKKAFDIDSQSTVGMEFSTRTIEFEKSLIKAQIWDTAGNERFDNPNMNKVYYRDAVGAALVFDICNKASFENIKTRWINQIKDHGHQGMRVILVGNKTDLPYPPNPTTTPIARAISTEEAIAFAKTENIDYIETSALTGYNVECMFRRLVLSTARILPDISHHLDLAALPVGYMIFVSSTENIRKRQSVTALNTLEIRNQFANTNEDSVRNQLNLDVDIKLEKRYSNRTISTPGRIGGVAGAGEEGGGIAGGGLADNAADLPRSFPLTAPTLAQQTDSRRLVVTFMNYWTGAVQSEFPTGPAPTTLLFEAEDRKASSVREVESEDDRGGRASLDSRGMTERSSSTRTLPPRASTSRNSLDSANPASVNSNRSLDVEHKGGAGAGASPKVRCCVCCVIS